MQNRTRILDAAAHVYAEFGYRGATTRRIAQQAGVNEVTLFRTFGSKAALIDEALRARAAAPTAPDALPELPVDPERELTAWAAAHVDELRRTRSLMRKAMSELEERPDAAPCVAQGVRGAGQELRRYMLALGTAGFVDWSSVGGCEPAGAARRGAARTSAQRNEDAFAAGAMLMAALFSDAMGRDMMPELYPQPAERAPALYVRMFLRAVGCVAPARRAPGSARARSRRPHHPSTKKTP